MIKRKILSWLTVAAIIVSVMPYTAFAADFGGGNGTPDDPYQISTVEQLMAIDDTPENLGKDYILTEDIDMGGETWTPIGIFESTGEMPNEAKAFHGTFDGNGKTIAELKIDGAGTMGAALFGVVANGTVKDLTIENASITGNCMAAAAVGYAYQSTIDNVDLSGTNAIKAERTSTAPSMVSGIVGASIDSTIQNCDVIDTTLTIEGNSAANMVGSNAHDIGLMGGGLEGGSLKNCTAAGKIICNSDADFIYGVGGLAGCMMSADSVTSCSTDVEIKLGDDAYLIGGLLGYTGTTGDAAASAISDCYAEGSIIAGADSTRIGQLLGGGFYMPSTVAYYPLPTRFTVFESSATTTGADALVGYATGLDSVDGSVGTEEDVFTNGTGMEGDPYEISTAVQLYAVRYGLDKCYKLTADVNVGATFDISSVRGTTHRWIPIGAATMTDFDEYGNVDQTKVFTGSLDGDGYMISNLTVQDDGTLIGVGLFGTTGGSGVIENLILKDVTVTGTENAMAVGGLVGYAMSSGATDNVTMTATNQNIITGTNCIGGLVGGGTSPNNCTVENTTIDVFGDNTDSNSEYSFSIGRLVQHDVAECAGLIIGGGFGGTIVGNTVNNCTINANQTSGAVEAVGLGGIGGCLQCMTEITDNNVSNLSINAPNGHAIGGLAGYAGNGNMADYGFGTDCAISDCTVTGLAINADGATHVGGLIGTNMYYNGMEGQFDITDCSVAGTITAGTDETSIYGVSTPGAVVGHAAGCSIDTPTQNSSNIGSLATIGTVSLMYESVDQDDTKNQTEAGAQLNALIGTYQQLFQGATFEAKCDAYWHDATAAIVGESNADSVVQMLKASVGSDKYGSNKEDDAFCCKFINGVDRITFNGTEISGTKNGDIVFSHPYQCIGTYYIGESEGIEGFGGYVMQSLDNNEDEFKYFLMLPDTMDSSNHIEFRYGSDLDELQLYGQGEYANWVAAGISVDAMNETTGSIGEVDNQLRQVIALFCEENSAYDATGTLVPRSAEALAQLNDFVGIWDANDATLAVMHNYPGFENAKMYVDFKADGTAKTYVAVDGVNYAVSSSYNYFAYDNSSSDKTGVYLVDSAEGVSTAPYEIVTAGSETTLSLYASDGTSAWIKRVAPTRRSSGGGSTSYTVTYKTNGGTEIVSSRISRNSILSEPSVPTKEGYIFDGWYTDSQLSAKYDFSAKVTKSLTLYAKWNEKSIDNSKNEIVLTIGKKEVNVFGETKVNDVAPIIKNNRTMLPARFVAESLGATVIWNESVPDKVTITKGNIKIIITINSDKAMVDDKEVVLDSPAFIENDRTYTPIRFIAENLGAKITWNENDNKVVISK